MLGPETKAKIKPCGHGSTEGGRLAVSLLSVFHSLSPPVQEDKRSRASMLHETLSAPDSRYAPTVWASLWGRPTFVTQKHMIQQ